MKSRILAFVLTFTMLLTGFAFGFFNADQAIENTSLTVSDAYHYLYGVNIERNQIAVTIRVYESKAAQQAGDTEFKTYTLYIRDTDADWSLYGAPVIAGAKPSVKDLVKHLMGLTDQDFE